MNEHINTFNKGMTSDMSIVLQPDGTYRYAKNCQLISQDGNNYTIKDCLGNVLTFQINIPYASYINPRGVPAITFQTPPIPIMFVSFPNRLIVLSTNIETDPGGYGEIGEIKYDPYGVGIQPKANSPTNTYSGYVPLYHHTGLNFSKMHKPEGFAFNENEIHQRIYWTDNNNDPRVFDVADVTFTTYYTGSGDLTVGNQYMVLEGVVTHNGFIYSPDVTSDGGAIAPNVFTAANTNFTDMFGGNIPTTAKVIKYYPYQLLAFTPTRALGNMKFNSYGTGSVICGSKQYFYRLSDPLNGLFTSWSYGSAPIHVGTMNSITSSPSNTYFDFVGGGNNTATLSSGKSVKIDISNIDTNFSHIQLAVAEFDQSLEVPRQIVITIDTLITGSSMTLEHTGQSIQQLSLSDITLFPASILTCKTLTTDKNYILAGNIKERSEFTIDLSAVTLSEIYSNFPVHEFNSTMCNNVLTYSNTSPNSSVNPGFIIIGCQYVVTSVAGGNVTYNAVSYGLGAVFTGVANVSGITIPAGSQIRPCVYRNKYTTTGGTPRPDVIQFSTLLANNESAWTYKNPAVASHKLGYWAGEMYRFGVLFYDLKGNPMYVRWIGDHTFAKIAQGGGDLMTNYSDSGGAYNYWFLNQRAISISGLTIPASIINQISGFSIVRADRDKRIITEGMLMQTGADATNQWFKPIAGPDTGVDSEWLNSVNSGKNYIYICPDMLVNYPMPAYTSGSNIEGVQFLSPTDYTGGSAFMKCVDIATQVESRYFTCRTYDNIARKQKIVTLASTNEGGNTLNFGTTNLNFSNSVQFSVATSSPVDGACIGVGSFNLAKYYGVGGRKSIMEIDGDPLDYSGAANYGNLAAVGNSKLIFDVTIDNTNQYGGTSDSAKANTLYISTGHFQPITAAVKTDTLDINGNYTFNNIEVWGGDCYTCLVVYGHSLHDDTVVNNYSWGIKFPCQSNTNYNLRRGRTVENNKMFKGVADNGVWYRNAGVAQYESFEYNYGYSSHGIEFTYPALPVNFNFASQFKQRIRFGGVKFPNELVNSFRTFLVNDYKDIDAQGGEINNLRYMNGRVVVWQNAITSVVPVLERQLLSGLDGAATTLGTGGVVDRYDPVNSYFGNQHQHGLTPTEYGFIWFDMRRKAVVVMDLGAETTEISKALGLAAFFSEEFIDNIGQSVQTTPINSPTFDPSSDRPLQGVGITGVYDSKFKMSYLTFKFKNYPVTSQPLARDFTIGFYHPDKIFVAFYDWTPAIAHNHNGIVLSSKNPQNKTKFYGSGMASTNFVLGDVIANSNIEYICTTAGNVPAYSDPPDNTLFTETNQTNQIWVHNQPATLGQSVAPDYLYNSFFGQVIDNEIDIVINPKSEEPFSVMAVEQHGNNVYPTAIEIEAGGQSATETVRSTSVNWRYIYDKICHNLPQDLLQGRITNKYLTIKIIKRNWTTNPTVVSTSVKILQYLKSKLTLKR